MKKYFAIFMLIILFAGCGGGIDTANLSPEEYFNYAFELYSDEDYELAVKEFQNLLLQFPGNVITDDAQFYLAMTYFQREEFLLSAYEFSKLIRDIPASTFVPEAQYMLAESYYQLSPVYPLDQAYSKKAIDEFQAFIDFFPANAKVEEAEGKIKEMNEKLAEKEYESAYIYERMDYYNAAIMYYENVTETYHDTKYAPTALYHKIKLLVFRERFSEAINDISRYLSKYIDGKEAEELRELQAELLNGNV